MEVYEKKKILNELGSYRPAFLKMWLSFPFPSTDRPLYTLTEGDMAVFVHEYIHFLQDISSYCLLNNAYVYSEYIHNAIQYIRAKQETTFEIPLRMPRNYGNVDANLFVNEHCIGDSEEVEDLFIIRVKLQSEQFPYPGVGLRCIDKRYLVTPEKDIHFGYLAIMESMAYIIESLISHPQHSPCDYPYMSAQMVVEKVYPEFRRDILNVLALCDASLQYSNPGNVFVGMLEQMRDKSWLPNQPEDVYQFVYGQHTLLMGYQVTTGDALVDLSTLVEERIKSYITDPRVSPEFEGYVHRLLNYGLFLRLHKPYFMLDIARGDQAINNKMFLEIISKIGVPIIEDKLKTFHTVLPYGITYEGPLFEYFLAIEQIQKCLRIGADFCEMYEFCEDSMRQQNEGILNGIAPVVNDNCANAPWKHCSNNRLCPYATLWKLWGLDQRQPILGQIS